MSHGISEEQVQSIIRTMDMEDYRPPFWPPWLLNQRWGQYFRSLLRRLTNESHQQDQG